VVEDSLLREFLQLVAIWTSGFDAPEE